MGFGRKFVVAICAGMLLLTAACNKFMHKTKATPPPRAQAPTTVYQPLPDKLPESEPDLGPVVQAKEEPKPPESKAPPKKTRRNTTATNKKATQPTTAATANPANGNGNGTTTVASNRLPEPVPNTAIGAVLPVDTAAKDKQSTAQLLDSAERTVKSVDDRSLSEDQKAMISQILSYINQSKKASSDGDLERALNLAKKAQLLADTLVKK